MTLIDRLMNGSGPDRELDGVICGALGAAVNPKNREYIRWPDDDDIGGFYRCPPLTNSLDACIDLAARVLPGFIWGVQKGQECTAWIERPGFQLVNRCYHSTSICHAFLLALIKAKDAKP